MDLKLPGYEREVVDGLARRGLAERSLVSTMYPESLDRLGELRPGLRRGWSVPRVRRDYTRSALALPAYRRDRARDARRGCRRRRRARIRAGGCEAIMAHRLLVSRAPRAGGARGRRRALRLDRGRRRRIRALRGARRGRRDHERPAAVRQRRLGIGAQPAEPAASALREGAAGLRATDVGGKPGLGHDGARADHARAVAPLHLGETAQLLRAAVGGLVELEGVAGLLRVWRADPTSSHGELGAPSTGSQVPCAWLYHWSGDPGVDRARRRRRRGR